MKGTFFSAVVALAIFAISCNGNKQHDADMDMDGLVMALDVEVDNTIDPVCDMEAKAGMVYDTIHYNNKIYGFCSTHCKEEFAKNPNDYLSKMN
ncbi:MAG: YHS domain-containing protein [Weeksellaceae bacterium]